MLHQQRRPSKEEIECKVEYASRIVPPKNRKTGVPGDRRSEKVCDCDVIGSGVCGKARGVHRCQIAVGTQSEDRG